jgi:hypothetical protein
VNLLINLRKVAFLPNPFGSAWQVSYMHVAGNGRQHMRAEHVARLPELHRTKR